MSNHDFSNALEKSRVRQWELAPSKLRFHFDNVLSIRQGTQEEDLKGADIVVTLSDGSTVNVDVKIRGPEVKEYWKRNRNNPLNEPEITIEIESKDHPPQIGWTFDENKITDAVLFVFDGTPSWIVFDFRCLQSAAKINLELWKKKYGVNTCSTDCQYTTTCVHVPESVVIAAINSLNGGGK